MENDLTYIVIIFAFFALAGLLTLACDKIIGPDPVDAVSEDEDVETEEVAA